MQFVAPHIRCSMFETQWHRDTETRDQKKFVFICVICGKPVFIRVHSCNSWHPISGVPCLKHSDTETRRHGIRKIRVHLCNLWQHVFIRVRSCNSWPIPSLPNRQTKINCLILSANPPLPNEPAKISLILLITADLRFGHGPKKIRICFRQSDR